MVRLVTGSTSLLRRTVPIDNTLPSPSTEMRAMMSELSKSPDALVRWFIGKNKKEQQEILGQLVVWSREREEYGATASWQVFRELIQSPEISIPKNRIRQVAETVAADNLADDRYRNEASKLLYRLRQGVKTTTDNLVLPPRPEQK